VSGNAAAINAAAASFTTALPHQKQPAKSTESDYETIEHSR
jgi:hypothetical protein